MKKVLLSIVATLLVVAFSQAQTSFGLRAGLNLAKFSGEKGTKNLSSFQGTAFVDIPLSSIFSIQPGLSIQGKGSTFKGILANEDFKNPEKEEATITPQVTSLEVPVHFVYYISAGDGKIFVGAGPFIGLNLSGNIKAKASVKRNSMEAKEKLKFSAKDKTMERLDAGANFMLGYKLGMGLSINAAYGLGLANLSPIKEGKGHKSRVLSFAVGFQF